MSSVDTKPLPPGSMGWPIVGETFQFPLKKYKVPNDWTVIYSIRDTHNKTRKLLPAGDVFRPSRWLKQDGEQVDKASNHLCLSSSNASQMTVDAMRDSSSCHFLPFGVGPRMCLGRQLAEMIMAVFVVSLAGKAQWTLLNPDCPFVHLPVTKPSDDMPVLFQTL